MDEDYADGLTERNPDTARGLLKTGDQVATAAKVDVVSRIDHLEAVEDEEDIASSNSNMSMHEAGQKEKDDPEIVIQNAINKT